MPLVERGDRRGVGMEDLAPVRARSELGERCLDVDQHRGDVLRQAPPGEVDGDGVLCVRRAHPQPVGGHGAELAHEQERPHPVGEGPQLLDGGDGVPARQQELRLDLLPRAGREPHPEVRQPVVPRPGPTELRSAGAGIDPVDRIALDGGRPGVEEVDRPRLVEPRLHPHHVDRVEPAREDADAVPGGHDLVEVLGQGVPAQVLEDALPHLEGGHDVQGEPDDRAERAQPHDRSVEVAVAPRHPHQCAVRRHQLQPGHRGGEVAVADAGAVRRRRHGARDRDVREGSQVAQGQAGVGQPRGQLPVRQARAERDRARRRIEDDVRRQRRQRDEVRGVGDPVERVPGAQDAHARRPRDEPLYLLDAGRPVQPCRSVAVVARPVRPGQTDTA